MLIIAVFSASFSPNGSSINIVNHCLLHHPEISYQCQWTNPHTFLDHWKRSDRSKRQLHPSWSKREWPQSWVMWKVVALHMGAECRNRKNVKTLADQHAAKHLLVKRCEKDEQNNVITRHQPVLEIPTMPTEVLEMHRGLDHGTSHAPEHTWHHRSQGHQPRYSIDRKGWSIFAANAKLCFSQKKWSLIWFSCLKEPTLPNFEERQCTNVLYLRILTDTHSNIIYIYIFIFFYKSTSAVYTYIYTHYM